MVTKEEILGLIELLDKQLLLYEDPVYSPEERKDIKRFEKLTLELYSDLKKDGYITLKIPEQERKEGLRMARFSKIAVDIPNKLLKIEGFKAEEQWYILLSVYCWWCEAIKNVLSEVAIKIYQSLKGKEWEKEFITIGPFINVMNEYRGGKYASLFLDITVDLRNSFVHGKVDFPNNEVVYYDSKEAEKKISLKDFLSQFKRLPPLCTYLFAYRLKPFREEIEEFARKSGFV